MYVSSHPVNVLDSTIVQVSNLIHSPTNKSKSENSTPVLIYWKLQSSSYFSISILSLDQLSFDASTYYKSFLIIPPTLYPFTLRHYDLRGAYLILISILRYITLFHYLGVAPHLPSGSSFQDFPSSVGVTSKSSRNLRQDRQRLQLLLQPPPCLNTHTTIIRIRSMYSTLQSPRLSSNTPATGRARWLVHSTLLSWFLSSIIG